MKNCVTTLLILLLCQLLSGCSEQPMQQIELRAWLQYFPGEKEGPAVLRLTLFVDEKSAVWPRDELLRIVSDERMEHFRFEMLSNEQRTPLESLQAHGKIVQQNQGSVEMVMLYRLKSSQKPAAGSSIKASCSTSHLLFTSNTVKVPGSAKSPFYSLQRKAKACDLLQDSKCLETVGDEMLRQYPTTFASYWFAALALEQSGNNKEALSMLEKGLSYLPNPDDSTPSTGYRDISPAVYKKINKLYKVCNPLY